MTVAQSPSGELTGFTRRRPGLLATRLMAGMFMAILDSFIVVVAGPSIQASLVSSAGELQWILAGYQLSYAVFTITGGRLADLHGHRRVFIVGVAVFMLSSIACAVAWNPGTLIGARVVQGLGSGLMVPQAFAVITVLVSTEARHRVFAVLGIVIGMGTICGQLIGGLLIGVDVFGSGWRAVFWVNVPIALITIVLALRHLPQLPGTGTSRLDIPGVAALSVALLGLMFSLIHGAEMDWPGWVLISLLGSALGFVLFLAVERLVERRGGAPLLKLSLFSQRSFSLGLVLVLCVYSLLSSYYLALSVSMQVSASTS